MEDKDPEKKKKKYFNSGRSGPSGHIHIPDFFLVAAIYIPHRQRFRAH